MRTITAYLVISDLDDTILGDDDALDRFAAFCAEDASRLQLVYASGRLLDSVRREVEDTALPAPVLVIGGVGSEIRHFVGGEPLRGWRERIERDWCVETARAILTEEPDLTLQPEEVQNEFKLSYFLPDASNERLDELIATLERGGVPADRIYSSRKDLDFVPRGVNKGTAAAFVAQTLGYASDRVIVAGNSGNDIALFQHGFSGIVVANAHEELKAIAKTPRIYLAKASYADGVREGIVHWLTERSDVRPGTSFQKESHDRDQASLLAEGYRRSVDSP